MTKYYLEKKGMPRMYFFKIEVQSRLLLLFMFILILQI